MAFAVLHSLLARTRQRVYDPDDGEILLDGIDIRHFDVNDYRALASAVFQDFSRYHLSVRENIDIARHELISDDLREAKPHV